MAESLKLQFPDENLPDIEELLAIANVSEADVEAAAQAWKDDPPDENFALLLEAIEADE